MNASDRIMFTIVPKISLKKCSADCVLGQQQLCPHRLLGYWVLVTNWPEPFTNIITSIYVYFLCNATFLTFSFQFKFACLQNCGRMRVFHVHKIHFRSRIVDTLSESNTGNATFSENSRSFSVQSMMDETSLVGCLFKSKKKLLGLNQ